MTHGTRLGASALALVASSALAGVCDKLAGRSVWETAAWLMGPLLACVVTTLLVMRGSTLAPAVATVLAIVGFVELKDQWPLLEAARAEPCGATLIRDAWLRGAALGLLFAVPNVLWSLRRLRTARRKSDNP